MNPNNNLNATVYGKYNIDPKTQVTGFVSNSGVGVNASKNVYSNDKVDINAFGGVGVNKGEGTNVQGGLSMTVKGTKRTKVLPDEVPMTEDQKLANQKIRKQERLEQEEQAQINSGE